MLPGVIVIALLFGIAVWVAQMQTSAANPAAASAPAAGAAPAAPAAVPTPSPIELLSSEVKALKLELDGVTNQLKGLRGTVDSLPKPAPPPDLAPIEHKVAELGQSLSGLMPLTDKVDKLAGRASGVDSALAGLKGKLAGLSAEFQKISAAGAATPAEAGAPSPTAGAGASGLDQAIELFKARKYAEAGDAFQKLESTRPNDPRVYYYEAFSNALNTNDWQGEKTLGLAARGASAEKAGAVKPADIDAAFADLPANLQNWLAYFRKQAR